MSNSNSHAVSPTRPGGGRHQIKRSISEIASPSKGQRSQNEPRHHEHRHRHHLHRKDHQHHDNSSHSALPAFHLRHSLDTPRPDAAAVLNPVHSRRPSGLLQDEDGTLERDEQLQQEREKALFRAE